MKTHSIALLAFMLVGLCMPAFAGNILFISDEFAPDDAPLTALLTGFGHSVIQDGNFAGGPPSAAYLGGANPSGNPVDLILVSRKTNSGNYDDGTEPQDWNALTLPILLMNPYITRTSRWGWINSTSIVNAAPSPAGYDPYPDPTHPFIDGLLSDPWAAGTATDYINSTAIPASATLVATMTFGTDVSASIVDIPAGTVSFGGKGTIDGRRVLFQLHDYSDNAEVFHLSPNGELILDQILDDMIPLIPEPASLGLLGVGTAVLLRRRRRR
jgi:hypothetical protein